MDQLETWLGQNRAWASSTMGYQLDALRSIRRRMGCGALSTILGNFVCHLACLSDSIAAKIKRDRCLTLKLTVRPQASETSVAE